MSIDPFKALLPLSPRLPCLDDICGKPDGKINPPSWGRSRSRGGCWTTRSGRSEPQCVCLQARSMSTLDELSARLDAVEAAVRALRADVRHHENVLNHLKQSGSVHIPHRDEGAGK